jgi:hypothetical protein
MTLRTISYGGGVQSTAMVVLAATRDPDFEAAMGGPVDAALFANVGDDSEHPATLAYVRDVAIPWAHGRGFAVHELHRTNRAGDTETLLGRIMRPDTASVPLPIRGVNGAPGTRSCTADFKVQVVAKWLKQHGATKDAPATVAIGISTDEVQRIGNKKNAAHERAVYPLIELGLDRQGCMNVTASAGLPVPGKSSCFFCPFHRPQVWAEMRRDEPDLFQKSVEIERYIIDQQTRRDRLPLYLTRFGKPLDEAISEAQDQLPGFESIGESGCDEGYCFT